MRSLTAPKAQVMTIGALSRRTGVNIETIRYYERIKMLAAPPRTEGGHRLYGPDDLRVLRFIRRSRELGFTLEAVRALLRLGAPGRASCGEVCDIAQHHLNDIRAKVADLKRLDRVLTATIAQCAGGATPECAVLDILTAEPMQQPARKVLRPKARRTSK